MIIDEALNSKTVASIYRHYLHAKEKHPYFCDRLMPKISYGEAQQITEDALTQVRDNLKLETSRGSLIWDLILNCEVWEIHEAIANRDVVRALEECYDAIAVLLRVVDVLEGRQKLGRAKEVK